jgi:putative flippase GtrA
MNIISKYVLFCIVAIFVNLLVQRIFLDFSFFKLEYFYALLLGTIAGLVTKYILDKYYIFKDFDNTIQNNSKKFLLYSINGIFTTLIFWGTESFFFFMYETIAAREFGAILGLSMGYFLKFKLDKKFVFQK